MYKVIVSGTRTFAEYSLLETRLIHFFYGKKPSEVQIVSGSAGGADKLGEKFAKEKGCHLKIFSASWDEYGELAEYQKIEEMVKYADACVVLWDGKSKGTQHMIELADKEGLELVIIKY